MEAIRLEVLVVDHDRLGANGVVDVLENQKYPNHCLNPHVMAVEAADLGEWTDEHPLNQRNGKDAEYRRLFGSKEFDVFRAGYEAAVGESRNVDEVQMLGEFEQWKAARR